MSTIMSHWFPAMAGRFAFPGSYTTWDIETSGLSPETALICSIGHTVVRNDAVVENEETYLDWTRHPDIDQEQFRHDLLTVERNMRERGEPFHHTYERLQQFGKDPLEVLNRYLEFAEDLEDRGEVLVMHNGVRFDTLLLEAAWERFLHTGWDWNEELVFDSGAAVKASQLSDNVAPLPATGESLWQWAYRISNLRIRGVRWSLTGYCEERYGLMAKAGISDKDAHRPAVDSYLVTILMGEFRRLAGLAG
jgi:hypothetical protein